MKQLNFLAPSSEKPAPTQVLDITYWKMFIDGAARNNPGPAGAGVCILKNDVIHERYAYFLGPKTNNQAEYLALVLGLTHLAKNVKDKRSDAVLIVSDSLLLVRQIKGAYKVRNPDLQKLHALAHSILAEMNYDALHIMREDNEIADALANKGIDKKIMVPADVQQWLRKHDVSL